MNEPKPVRAVESALESPPASYAGHTRYTQLEYEAILANASIGIAFTRDRRFFLCNPKFAEMFGWSAEELIGQPGEVVYPNRESYEALGRIAVPVLSAGRQLDLEWEVRKKDGSTFLCRMIAKAISEADTRQGTVWIVEDITEKRRHADEIERLLNEQELILDNATVGIVFVRNRVIQRCNRFLEEMLGAEPGELIGKSSLALFVSEDDWKEAGRIAYAQTQPGGTHESEWRFRRKDGSTFLCRMRGRRIDAGEPLQEWIWSYDDVTAEREAELRVQRALAEQELILDNATVGIVFSRGRVIERCNPRFEEMFGYAPGELAGKSSEILFPSRAEFERAGRAYALLARGRAFSVERQVQRRDASLFWCKVVGRAIDPAHPHEGSIWIYDDVSAEHAARDALERAVAERTTELKAANERLEAEIAERKLAEQRAQHLADHDALTGLPNRRLLEDRLTQALALSQRNRKQTAVMFVDLDRFKNINDSLGHSVGDALLKETSQRLVRQLRVGDTVCRIGGDEFVVVLPEVKRSSDVANVAQKVIEQLSQPVGVEDRELTVTSSIGISVFPVDGRDAETLIRNADAAMYHAKQMGRANYQFFTAEMNQAASRRLALENDLRRALGKDELRVYYQPIVELASGRVAGHEALVRWQHPERGLVPPAEFIQIAEESGLILGLGEWVLREACRWATTIGVERGLPVSVNLSARQFSDPKLPETVARALQDSGLPARLLELEITESTAMQHTDATLATLKKLKALGVSITIDDFGTGYSSLSYLQRFPVDKLKVDRAFVAELPGGRGEQAIVAAMIALARALGIPVIAEGVETEAQRAFLARCECGFIQGYRVGQPGDADTAARPYV